MHHRWQSLLFVHWRLPAARVQQTLPAGLTVDTFDGDAYVGVVPFLMRQVRPVGLPAVPRLSNFHELNVRTYAYDRDGVPGVWFYSLSCDQPLAVLAARLFTGLHYVNAQMSSADGDAIEYWCRRGGSNQVAQYRYRPSGPASVAPADSLEFFLLERYYLFARRAGSLVRAQVAHHPYEIRRVVLDECSATPAHLDGFDDLSGPPVHVCAADRVDVNVYGTQKLA